MSEDAISRYKGVDSRIIDDLVRERRLENEERHARQQENARRYIEDLRRNRRLEDDERHARQQENARRFAEDLMRKRRLAADDDLMRERRLLNEAAHTLQQVNVRRYIEDSRRMRRSEDDERHARQQENARRFAGYLMCERRLAAGAPSALPSPTHNEPAPFGKSKGIPAEDRLTSPTATTPAGPSPPAPRPTGIHADNTQSLGSVKSNGAQTANKVKGKNIDARMLKITIDNPLSLGWTAKEWALHLGCADSTVKESKTWKVHLKAVRAMQKVEAAERMGGKGKRRKG